MFQQTAFAMVKAFGMSGGLALGYFASGCAPGGGSSNMYSYLLGGDVSLSVTMTLISIAASLGNQSQLKVSDSRSTALDLSLQLVMVKE